MPLARMSCEYLGGSIMNCRIKLSASAVLFFKLQMEKYYSGTTERIDLMNFHETRYGARFFDGQLPKLISALTGIATALTAPKPVYQLKPTVPENFLADLYHGTYDPSDLPNTEAETELMSEIISCQQQLRETVTPDVWALIERYGSLLSRRGVTDREQAFATGFRTAMTMLAAGLAYPTKNETEE